MSWTDQIALGRSGLEVGRLGISSSYGAPAEAFEEALERGCNYFTWGTFIRGRSSEMAQAIRNIIKKGKRDDLVLSMISYAHQGALMEWTLKRGLKALGTDRAEVLLIGYYNRRPPQSVIDRALDLKARGLIRAVGLTSHNRKLFAKLADDDAFDLFHLRYNAAHRGAETEVFPHLGETPAGIVSFTATRWGKLLKQKSMPEGESAPSAGDCYRFVLSQPSVDVCMVGPRDREQMQQALSVLERGPLDEATLQRMRRIGDHVHG